MPDLSGADIRKRFEVAPEDTGSGGTSGGAAIRQLFDSAGQDGTSAPAAPGTTVRGVVRNAVAGEMEGAGAGLNVLHDPFGNLILRPLTTAGAFAYDLIAPRLGLPAMTPEQRADLTGDTEYKQPGSALAQAAGAGDVQAATPAERYVRAGTAGATASLLAPAGFVPLAAGAAGGVGGQVASDMAPDWAQPYAQFGGILLGGGAGALGAAGLLRAGQGGINLLRQATSGPVDEHPLAPRTSAPQLQGPQPPPAAAVPAGGPQSVGAAAAPPGVIGLSPQEEAAYKATAQGQKLIEPQPIGIPDTKTYVPGVAPNASEIEQTVNTARELKAINVASPEVSQRAKEIAAENNDARSRYLADTVKSPVDIMRETAAQQADIDAQKTKVFANAKPITDVQPIVQYMQDVLSRPEARQNTPLQQDFAPILKRIVNDDGTPKITDPQEMWGLRQDLQRLTSKRMAADNPNLHYVGHELNGLADTIDKVIEPVAPGYREMMDTYAAHARKIDEMSVLQGHEKGLYEGAGGQMRITFNKVQRMMRNIVDMQSTGPQDLNAYKAITPETMDRLWALRDDLRRSASAMELAKTPGSDTAQNVWDAIKGLASGPEAQTALHAFAASHFGLPGYVATKAASAILSPILSGRTAARTTQRGMQLLQPPQGPPNLLQPPP